MRRMIGRGPVALRYFVGAAILAGGVFASGCAGPDRRMALPTAPDVDLSRYTGRWHEIARLPMWAQRRCVTSTADYRLLDSGDIGVRNACVTKTGDVISIDGVATVVDRRQPSKLNVTFDQWAARAAAWFTASEEGNYWILRIDPEYRWVVVGTPDREYLWILSRTPALDDSIYQELVTFGRRLGFPTEHLLRAPVLN